MRLFIKEDPKPTPEQIAKANQFARQFAMRKGLLIADNAHVGESIPKFIDSLTGKESKDAPGKLPARTITDISLIPSYVKNLEWDKELNVPYYVDEKTGDLQYVHPDFFHSKRFNPNAGLYGVSAPDVANGLVSR